MNKVLTAVFLFVTIVSFFEVLIECNFNLTDSDTTTEWTTRDDSNDTDLLNMTDSDTTTKSTTRVDSNETDSSTVSATTTKRTPSKDYTLIIVLGVIALLIIVVSIVVIVCLICKERPKKASVFKGLKPATRSPFRNMRDLKAASDLNSNTDTKSEVFSVKSGVDYSKPIPLKSQSSVSQSNESIVRPTDLNVKPKPK